MKLRDRVRGWRRRRRFRKSARRDPSPLREFIYLDEVSVYSLLASRRGPIATEYTESEMASLNSELEASAGGSFGIGRGDVKSRVEAGQTRGSQVLRKSIIQTTFKELHDQERDSLVLRPVDRREAPALKAVAQLQEAARSRSQWLIDPAVLRRGDLMEAEIELETESIFRVSAVVTTILEIMQENLQLFGSEGASHLPQVRAVGRVLESLLAGLVPIRGRLVDYEAVELDNGREILVHRAVLDQLDEKDGLDTRPVHVVGVAERNLFWKDIRRVLFARSRFRVFCRVAVDGLADEWKPVKLVDVLNEIDPLLGQQVSDIGDVALEVMEGAVSGRRITSREQHEQRLAVAERFATLLAEHHGHDLEESSVVDLVSELVPERDWLRTVDERRSVFASIADRMDEVLAVETSKESAAHYRVTALVDMGLGLGPALESAKAVQSGLSPRRGEERFLDTEIVAIYW